MLTCGLLFLHDGGDVLLVGSLLGASLGVLVLLSGESALCHDHQDYFVQPTMLPNFFWAASRAFSRWLPRAILA